jgi:hypothetical protein
LLSQYNEIRKKLKVGDINPAVVVCERPWRIAVLANMEALGRGSKHAIKIETVRFLGRMSGAPPELGMRLAAVCFYYSPRDGVWQDFWPTVLACATENEANVQRATASIPAHQWAALENRLDRIPADRRGLYRLWEGTHNVYGGTLRHRIGAIVLIAVVIFVAIIWIVLYMDRR